MASRSKSAPEKNNSLESWIWDAACSIRGAKDVPKYKDFILPLVFTKRLCDVFDDEVNRIATEVGSRKKAFQLAKADHKLVRFYLPMVLDDPERPVWSVIRKLSDKIGEGVTTHMRAIAKANPLLSGIVDHAEVKKNDYNISPSRYIHTSDAEIYRPIAEIVDELDVIEAEAKETNKALRKILKQLGV